jgi:hypothetical protein
MAIADSARTLPTAATMAYWRVEPRPKGARSLRPQLGRYPIPSLAVGAVYGDIMTSTPTHVVESWRTRYGAGTRSYEPGDRLPVEPGTRNACHVFSGFVFGVRFGALCALPSARCEGGHAYGCGVGHVASEGPWLHGGLIGSVRCVCASPPSNPRLRGGLTCAAERQSRCVRGV